MKFIRNLRKTGFFSADFYVKAFPRRGGIVSWIFPSNPCIRFSEDLHILAWLKKYFGGETGPGQVILLLGQEKMSRPVQKLKTLQQQMKNSGETLSVAESCTGGKLSEWLTFLPGASDFFKGGVVSYWTEVKESLLQVDPQIIKDKGVVSEKTAHLMARGVKARLKTDWSLSVTGFAGPPNKKIPAEAGKVVFALCSPFAYKTCIRYFKGEREDVRAKAAHFALDFLLSELKNNQKEEI